MSNLYNLEPQPTAKVILSTTTGDLTLELFAKQTPLASRNFLQHCLDGYYNGTIFHRLVPEFIIQGGDPTGTGSGGEPAINGGEVFEDEIHTRLKFNRRGLLGMANEGPNSNGSQFFFTLDATPELQGKTTMFGRIEGDTIYNLMKMADAEVVEGSERPMYPTKITGAEILVNPFEDMVRRIREAPRTAAEEKGKGWKKRKKPAGKNVLSFGGEEGEDGEEEVVQVKKKVKANPKLVVVEEEAEVEKAPKEKRPKKKAKEDEPMPDADTEIQEIPNPTPRPDEVPESDQLSEQEESSEDEEDRRQRKLDKTNAEIQALKASMKRTVDLKPAEKQKPQSVLEAMIPETSTRGRKRGKVADEKGAFDLFNSFKKRLDDLPTAEPEEATVSVKKEGTEDAKANDEDGDEEAALCDLHFIASCQSCKSWDDDEGAEVEGDEENDTSWMAKKLTFAKDALGKDLEWKRKMAEIEVIDPREKAREIKEEKRKGKKERR